MTIKTEFFPASDPFADKACDQERAKFEYCVAGNLPN
mgnify:CR=1 FL=1